MTLTAEDAAYAYAAAQGREPSPLADSPLATFAVAPDSELDFCGDSERAALYQTAIERLEQAVRGGSQLTSLRFAKRGSSCTAVPGWQSALRLSKRL